MAGLLFGTTPFGTGTFLAGRSLTAIPLTVPDPDMALSARVGPDPARAVSSRTGPDPALASAFCRGPDPLRALSRSRTS